MMDMIYAFDFRVGLDGDGVEASLFAHHDESRLERRQRLHVGLGAHMLVAVENGQTIAILDRRDGRHEAPFRPGLGRALLAFDGVGVHGVARKPVFGGDEIGGNALRHEIGRNGDGGIDRPCAARGAYADAAHAFDAAADGEIMLARHDLRRGKIHRVEARGAEAVDLQAGDAVAIACGQGCGAADVAAGLAYRIDAAENDVVHQRGIWQGPLFQRCQGADGEAEGRDLMQRAIRFSSSARRAKRVVDESFRHEFPLWNYDRAALRLPLPASGESADGQNNRPAGSSHWQHPQ